MVFGIAKIRRIHISAMLSGLKLEADLQNVHASATHRERVKGNILKLAFSTLIIWKFCFKFVRISQNS